MPSKGEQFDRKSYQELQWLNPLASDDSLVARIIANEAGSYHYYFQLDSRCEISFENEVYINLMIEKLLFYLHNNQLHQLFLRLCIVTMCKKKALFCRNVESNLIIDP